MHSENNMELLYDNFSGIGSKIAGFADEIKKRGISPSKWVSHGWDAMTEHAHHSTAPAARGWVGNSHIGRHLPVGMKSLTLGFAAMQAPGAFAKEDSTGQGESRGARIGEWAGSNAGMVLGNFSSKVHPLAGLGMGLGASILGGKAGKYIGSKISGEPKAPGEVA